MSHGKKLTVEEAIAIERDLAKFSIIMDSLVRIPFTKQGVGLDAALSTIPIMGDIIGFALTLYAFKKARQLGIPWNKLYGVIGLALADMLIGSIPILGTLFDIFIRPSRKALDIVHQYSNIQHQINKDAHILHPFLHQSLQKKQQNSNFWRNPVISWCWLHIPDLLGMLFIILFIGLIALSGYWVWGWFTW